VNIVSAVLAFSMLLNLITALRRVEGGKRFDLHLSCQQPGWAKGIGAILYGVVALLAANHALREPFAFPDTFFLPAVLTLVLFESVVPIYYRMKGLMANES
jgi:hypothetical protein